MSIHPSSKIKFSEFNVTDGYISFFYEVQKYDMETSMEDNGHIFFELSPNIRPRSDLIALALSTLCGKKYNQIHYELEFSPSIVLAVSNFTNANVTALEGNENTIQRKKSNNLTLNFSGGFDSLAAKCLMPKDTNLVSMDFGGRFAREGAFFSRFSPCIVSTNLLQTPLRYNSWSFMGIASLLFKDYLDSDYHTFGSILEASNDNFTSNPVAMRNISFPPFLAAGIENAPYVLGLTEVGTVSVLSHYNPDLISCSLESLANVGEEKRYRKQVLSMIVSNKLKKDFRINIISPPANPYFKFGENFVVDFLTFYFIKNADLNVASHIVSNIPDEIIKSAENLSLNFYERLNTNFLTNFPKQFKGDLVKKLADANITPYTEVDWEEFHRVKQLLSYYHQTK